MMNLPKLRRGFTLIELLLVIAILSVLLVVVFASLNPSGRLQDTRNARRWNDVNQILTAIHECSVDNDGSLATCGFTLTDGDLALSQLGTCTGTGATGCTGAATDCVAGGNAELLTYIKSVPKDPSLAASVTDRSGYSVQITDGIVTVSACAPEGGETISVSR